MLIQFILRSYIVNISTEIKFYKCTYVMVPPYSLLDLSVLVQLLRPLVLATVAPLYFLPLSAPRGTACCYLLANVTGKWLKMWSQMSPMTSYGYHNDVTGPSSPYKSASPFYRLVYFCPHV